MTYKEREVTLCNNCEAKDNCSYISRNLERNCSFKETTMYGWELGWQDAIDKACEWLKMNFGFTIGIDGATIRDFCDFIEGENKKYKI